MLLCGLGVRDGRDAAEAIDKWIVAADAPRAASEDASLAQQEQDNDKVFDKCLPAQRRAVNEAKLTEAVRMPRKWNMMRVVSGLLGVTASQTGPLLSRQLRHCKQFGIAARLMLTV